MMRASERCRVARVAVQLRGVTLIDPGSATSPEPGVLGHDAEPEPAARVVRKTTRSPLLHEDITRAIIAAFYRVYNQLGYGFLESVYAAALAIELADMGLTVDRERSVEVRYRGQVVGGFRVDLIVHGSVVVELKSTERLDGFATRQLHNYLRCSDLEVGLVLHFGPRPSFHRVVHEKEHVG
jgi:GxxExxY protein